MKKKQCDHMIGLHEKVVDMPFTVLIVDTVIRMSDLPLVFISLLGKKRKKLKIEFTCCPFCEQHLDWAAIRKQLNQSTCTNTSLSTKGRRGSASNRSTKNVRNAKKLES